MTTPFDAEGLWAKAKIHINRSYDALERDDFEAGALWASSALELLGKSALAKVNPLLVADPQDEGRSLMIAAGLSSDLARFKSVPAKAIFSRCARAFPPFSEQEATRIAAQRNEELHSAVSPFTGLDEEVWWERYWAQAVILIHGQDMTVAEFVGDQRESGVEDYLARNAANVARRLEAMVERARRRWSLAASSQDVAREIASLVSRFVAEGDFSTATECPACSEGAHISGDYVSQSDVIIDHEAGAATEVLTVFAEFFQCEHCGLRLTGPDYLVAAGLPSAFEVEQEYEPGWDDYGND